MTSKKMMFLPWLVGTLMKQEKVEYICLFVKGSSRPNCSLDMRVLCTTSGVGNAGIDSPDVRCVYRIDFPPSVHGFVQEKGHAGCRLDASPSDYSYHVCISIESLLYLFKRILNPAEEVNKDNYCSRQVEDLLQMAQLIAAQTKCYTIAFESTVCYKTLEATIDYIHKYLNTAFKIFKKRVKN